MNDHYAKQEIKATQDLVGAVQDLRPHLACIAEEAAAHTALGEKVLAQITNIESALHTLTHHTERIASALERIAENTEARP